MGEKGGNLFAASGHGGRGGDLTLTGRIALGAQSSTVPGGGGHAGSVAVRLGSGGPGGHGRDASVLVGSPGEAGQGPSPPAVSAEPAEVIVSGGNGGDSEDLSLAGGNGGNVTIAARDNRPLVLHKSSKVLAGALSGGFGFNGCAVVPLSDGTDGGKGGVITSAGADLQIGSDALRGGDGGHGKTRFGTAGTFNGKEAGKAGEPGDPCGFSLPPENPDGYIAVKLDAPVGEFAAGDIIPLCRIRYGRHAAAEPLVGDFGCSSTHLHTERDQAGIVMRFRRIALAGGPPGAVLGWQLTGKHGDGNPNRCGYGKLVILNKCEIQAANPNLK